jgi:hypothetical protein
MSDASPWVLVALGIAMGVCLTVASAAVLRLIGRMARARFVVIVVVLSLMAPFLLDGPGAIPTGLAIAGIALAVIAPVLLRDGDA